MQPLFSLGKCYTTRGAVAALEEAGQNAFEFLARHQVGDWGDLDEEDVEENELSTAAEEYPKSAVEFYPPWSPVVEF